MSFVVTQRFTRPNTDISWFPLSTAGTEVTQELLEPAALRNPGSQGVTRI